MGNMCSLLLAIAFALAANVASGCDKKGVGLAEFREPSKIARLNVSWYYTWHLAPIPGVKGPEFVPMQWSKPDGETEHLLVNSRFPVLLSFNEPDRTAQAGLSVAEASGIWPRLESASMRLGSPATSRPGARWMRQFMEMAEERKARVDFVALHLYSGTDPNEFLRTVDWAYREFRRPIWITEFAVADWKAQGPGSNRYSEHEVLTFMQKVVPELEARDFVERYAWFGAGRSAGMKEVIRTSRLFEADGELSRLGRYYAQLTGKCSDAAPSAPSREPSS